MKIKGKLQYLLLVASLFPLLLISGLFLLLLRGLGDHFASDTKGFLVEQSHDHLQSMIRDSELLVRKNFQLFDWVLDGQIHEIKHKLRSWTVGLFSLNVRGSKNYAFLRI